MGISLLAHIALLFVPLPDWSSPEEQVPEEETPEEKAEGPIDILSLSEIAAPEPPPEALPEQPQQAAPQQQAASPPSGSVPAPPDPDQIQEAADETALADEAEGDFYDDELPTEDDLASSTPAFDGAAATDQFVGDLSGLGVGDFTDDQGLPPPEFLRNPGNAGCFIDPAAGPGPLSNTRVTRWLDKEPQTLLRENLKEVYEPRGIVFNELPPFCGERYFQAITAEGNPFMTFSLVQLTGSTLLVVWATPPQ
jgi:hypothetical protein